MCVCVCVCVFIYMIEINHCIFSLYPLVLTFELDAKIPFVQVIFNNINIASVLSNYTRDSRSRPCMQQTDVI